MVPSCVYGGLTVLGEVDDRFGFRAPSLRAAGGQLTSAMTSSEISKFA
jgi:hypothetical protein